MSDEGRRRHYGAFYGLEDLPAEDRPRLAILGNCQAEALRVAVDTSGAVASVRMPPVHELSPEDLPHLERVLAWADVVAAQRVSDGYRGLPVGTEQVRSRLRDGARLVPLPNYFSTVLYPEQVLVRHEDPAVVDPPVVPYHDARRIGRAAGWRGPDEPPAEAVRANAEASLAELERRERDQGSLVISDVVRGVGAEAGWTVDHPGNPVLVALARRLLDEIAGSGSGSGHAAAQLGRTVGRTVRDPGRTLLGSVLSPLRPAVLDALGLAGAPRPGWVVDGRELSDEEVGEAHLAFYTENPRVVEVGIEKKGDVLRSLGWAP